MDLSTIEKANKAGWYLIDGTRVERDEIPAGTFAVEIEKATPGDIRRLSSKANKSVLAGRRKAKTKDNDRYHRDLLHHCVKNWVNLTEEDKDTGERKPVPCDRANRERVDSMWADFSTLWQEVALDTSVTEDDEEDLGN